VGLWFFQAAIFWQLVLFGRLFFVKLKCWFHGKLGTTSLADSSKSAQNQPAWHPAIEETTHFDPGRRLFFFKTAHRRAGGQTAFSRSYGIGFAAPDKLSA